MSKIQEALSKLQKQGTARAPQPTPRQMGRVRDDEDMSRIMPMMQHDYGGSIVEVDRDALREAGLLAAVAEQRRIADQYRQIKRPLLANALGSKVTEVPRGNLIMVGSAIPGEGKTFTCINLALSIALERDWSVVLVDADCSKPHISHLFGLEDRPGLLDVLRESTSRFNDYVIPTDIPSLAILPAGQQDELASELLSSERMDRLAHRLSSEDPRRIVLFDTSPLLYTTESPIVSTHVGQVALVVAADRTAQQMVINAVELLDSTKAINAILNKAGNGDGMSGEYYGYGYSAHGRDGGADPRTEEAS
ncbi:MAG: hypothetical protein AAFQ62_08125 [Pseudomonadota bacterium]